ncbi:hypothetical protein ABZ876_29155 [Streptomyces sp. NPDC046931]
MAVLGLVAPALRTEESGRKKSSKTETHHRRRRSRHSRHSRH